MEVKSLFWFTFIGFIILLIALERVWHKIDDKLVTIIAKLKLLDSRLNELWEKIEKQHK